MARYEEWTHFSPVKSPNESTSPEAAEMQSGQYFEEFICGWGAASVNICATFPLNKVMFRQQVYGITMYASIRQLRREGLFSLYRGVLPPLLQKSTSMSIMFGMYDKYQKVISKQMPGLPQNVNKVIAAILAGCTEATLAPFERIQTLMQDRKYQGRFKNTFHAFRELKVYGVKEYYRGLTPVLLRNGPSNTLFFLFREEIKAKLPSPSTAAGDVAANFVSGGVLGAFISTAFFPVNVVKTHMQRTMGGEFISFGKMCVLVFNERNRSWQGIFAGVHINYTRSMMSWGIINATYEILKDALFLQK